MMVRIEYEGGRTTLFDTLSFTEGSPFSGANMLGLATINGTVS